MEWTQLKVSGLHADLDKICAVMCMLDNGLMIEDYSDVEKELDGVYGDLIDEELLSRDRTKASVSVFLPELRRTGPRSANYADKTANYACLRKIPGKNDNITQ